MFFGGGREISTKKECCIVCVENMNKVLVQEPHCSLDPTSQTLLLTSLANSCRVFRLRFPPRPLRRPTMNWPRSSTALRCDRPLKTVPTRLVSTTKSFCRNRKSVEGKVGTFTERITGGPLTLHRGHRGSWSKPVRLVNVLA